MSDLLQSLIASGIAPPSAVRINNAIISLTPKTEDIVAAAAKSVSASFSAVTAVPVVQPIENDGPTTFKGSIETQRSAVFSGDSQFSGGLAIDGDVSWKGIPIEPATVQAIGGMAVLGGNLHFIPSQLTVMSDYGPGKAQRVVLSVSPVSQVQVLTGAAVTAATTNVTSAQTGTFHALTTKVTIPTSAVGAVDYGTYSVLSTLSDVYGTTDTFSFPTTFTLNPDSCTITAGGTQTITYVKTVGLTKEPRTVAHSITSSAAPVTTPSLVYGGTVSVGGASVVVLTSVSATTTAVTVGNAAGAEVSAVISDPA
jgi:hypothetical protein